MEARGHLLGPQQAGREAGSQGGWTALGHMVDGAQGWGPSSNLPRLHCGTPREYTWEAWWSH